MIALSIKGQEVYDQNISTAFEAYKTAYLEVDRKKLLSFVHPHVIQISGGQDYVIEDMTNDYNMYASSGLVIRDLILKQGSKVIPVGEELQAMFPYERSLHKAGEELLEKGFFLLVSQDEGTSWTFTDMKKYKTPPSMSNSRKS